MTATPDLDFNIGIDLDAERDRRSQENEARARTVPIKFGGEVVAHVPTELPLDVLAPLRRLDEEVSLLLRTVTTAMSSPEARDRWDATSLVIDILAANPKLPTTLIDVLEDMTSRLLTEDGRKALMAHRPTMPDLVFLGRGLLGLYGLNLGESQPSSDSRTEEAKDAGTTSTPTLPTTTQDSTSEASGDAPESPASSERVAS